MIRYLASLALFVACPLAARPYATATTTSADGNMVFVYEYRPNGADSGVPVLLFHQAGGDARGELGPIAQRLVAQGRRVFTADLRSGGNRFGGENATAAAFKGPAGGYCDVYPDLVAALDKVVVQAKRRVILGGSSYSAALVVKLAAEKPALVAGFAAFSPAGGEPMKGCEPEQFLPELKAPSLVIRNVGPTAPPAWIADSNRRWLAAGRSVTTITAEGHGASLLLADRTKGDSAAAWRAFSAFLRSIDAAEAK